MKERDAMLVLGAVILAVGVSALPMDAAIEVEGSFEVD